MSDAIPVSLPDNRQITDEPDAQAEKEKIGIFSKYTSAVFTTYTCMRVYFSSPVYGTMPFKILVVLVVRLYEVILEHWHNKHAETSKVARFRLA